MLFTSYTTAFLKKSNAKIILPALLLSFSNSYCIAKGSKVKDDEIVAGKRADHVQEHNTIKNAVATNKGGNLVDYIKDLGDNERAKLDAKLPDTSNAEINYSRKLSNKLSKAIRYNINDKKDIIRPQENISYDKLKESLDLWIGFSYNAGNDKQDEYNTDPTYGSYALISFGGDTLTSNKITLGFAYSFAILDIDVYGALDKNVKKATHKINSHFIACYSGFDLNVINANFSILHAFNSHEKKDANISINPYKSSNLGIAATVESPMKLEYFNFDVGTNLGLDIASVKAHDSKHTDPTSTADAKKLVPEQSNTLLTVQMYAAIKNKYKIDENIKFNYKFTLGYKYIATFGNTSVDFSIPVSGTTPSVETLALNIREPDRHTALFGADINFEAYDNVSIGLNASFEYGTGMEYGVGLIGRYIF